jgi:hypothetical protein
MQTESLEITTALPEISTEMRLLDLVTILTAVDEGNYSLTPEQHSQLGVVLRNKVDNCSHFVDEIEDRVKRHREYAKQHAEAARTLERQLAGFLDYISFTMRSGGFEKLPGTEFQISLRRSEETVLKREPSPEDFEQAPEYVTEKRSYSWKKTEIKAALKTGTFPLSCASLKENFNPQFKIKKA